VKLLLVIFLLCVSAVRADATTLTLYDVPGESAASDALEVSVDFVTSVKNTTYYLAGVFFKTKGSAKFGFTGVSEDVFVPLAASPSSFYPITTSAEGTWSGTIRVKADIADPAFDGEGVYFLRIDRFTGKSDSAVESSNQVEIKLLFTPPATPAPSPTPSPPPTPKATATPKPTTKPTSSPTPKPSPPIAPTPLPTAPPPTPLDDIDTMTATIPAVMGIIDVTTATQSSAASDLLVETSQSTGGKTAPALILIGSLLVTVGIIPLSMKLFPR
jgi:hypothetical protein